MRPSQNLLAMPSRSATPMRLGRSTCTWIRCVRTAARWCGIEGGEIGKRIEAGKLRVNLRFVDFLDKYSASGTYDKRAIYAAYVVADQARSSDITWRFVQQIYSADQQPKEKGPTDLSNDQLADLAGRVGAPQQAQDLIRIGLPIGSDPHAIAADNFAALHQFPDPGVPLVVINGQPVDGESDWLAQLPG